MVMKDLIRRLRWSFWAIWLIGLMTGIVLASVTGDGGWFDRSLMLLGIVVFLGVFFKYVRRPLELLFGGEETRRRDFIDHFDNGEG